MPKLWFLGVAPVMLLLAAACSGDSKPEPLTLEQYFSQVDGIFKEQERRAEAIGEKYNDRLNPEASTLDEALEAAAQALPELLAEIRPVVADTVVALDELAPPSEVLVTHQDLVDSLRELLVFYLDLEAGLKSGDTLDAALEALFADASASELGQGLDLALTDLQAVADANGIEVDLAGGVGGVTTIEPEPPVVGQPPVPRVIGTDGESRPFYPREIRTGIAGVDVVLDVLLLIAGDLDAMQSLFRYVTTPCTLETGAGGAPKCWQVPGAAQVEGTLVEIFPTSVCEAEYHTEGEVLTSLLNGAFGAGLLQCVFSVYVVSADEAREPFFPSGDYAVVFVSQEDDQTWATTVRVVGGSIVRIDFGCGRQLPDPQFDRDYVIFPAPVPAAVPSPSTGERLPLQR